MPELIYMKNLIRNIISWHKNNKQAGKPKVILHVGVEKTGTTTIQEFLHLNRKLLADQGIFFPRFMNPRNHRKLAVFCCNDNKSNQFTTINDINDPAKRKKWKSDFKMLFGKEMAKIYGNFGSVIFSSEHLTTLLREQREIQYLKNFLESYASSFILILYIRRQDLLAGSMISNAAKSGHGKVLPKGREIFKRHFYNYNGLIESWSAIFGRQNIRVRIFENSQMLNGDLLQDFVQQAEVSQDERFILPGILNTSLSATAVEAAWAFNKKFPVNHTSIDIKTLKSLRLELISQANENYPGPAKMLLKQDAESFLEHYKKSNRQLAREWFDRDQLFSEDFSMYPDKGQNPNPDLAESLVEDFVKRKGLALFHE